MLADLEAEAYEVWPVVLPAVSKNAPHRRDRVWIVAHAINGGHRNIRESDRRQDGLSGEYREALCTRELDGADNGTTPNSNQFNGNLSGLRAGEIPQQQTTRILENITSDPGDTGLQGSEINGSIRRIGTNRNQQFTRSFPPNWDNFPTQSPVCDRNDGIPRGLADITFPKWRNESIKAMGNAWVPQVALQIFKSINEYEILQNL